MRYECECFGSALVSLIHTSAQELHAASNQVKNIQRNLLLRIMEDYFPMALLPKVNRLALVVHILLFSPNETKVILLQFHLSMMNEAFQ